MPQVTIYLPDELRAAVKRAGLPVSEVCQKALRVELERRRRPSLSLPDRLQRQTGQY